MNWVPARQRCNCEADVTYVTSMQVAWRGNPGSRRRAQQVWHGRARDGARFWHWSDVQPVEPPPELLALSSQPSLGV